MTLGSRHSRVLNSISNSGYFSKLSVTCKIKSCRPSHLSKAGEERNFYELSIVPGTGVTTGLQYKVAVLLHFPAYGKSFQLWGNALRSKTCICILWFLSSVADSGWLFGILDPNFYIPDPGSKRFRIRRKEIKYF